VTILHLQENVTEFYNGRSTPWHTQGVQLALPIALLAAAAYYPVPDTAGGWRSAAPTAAQRASLDKAFDHIRASTKHGGLLILYRGQLLYERYFGRASREATPNLASCGKSFTSIAAGILLSERKDLFPEGLDQKVFTPRYLPANAFPLDDAAKADIRLGQLLAMTAGLAGQDPGYVRGRPVPIEGGAGPDGIAALSDAAAFTTRLWTRPGEGYSYATTSPQIVSAMIRHITGMELQDYLDRRIAKPLAWGRWGFGYKSARVDHTPGGGGIALRATDMLRFGYLLLQQGRWRDRQIVPADYIRTATTKTIYNPHFPYSFQFDVNTDGQAKGVPGDAFWKSGSGGHSLYVVPSLDLVVWKLGGRDEQYNETHTNVPPPATPLPPYDGSRESWRAPTSNVPPEEFLREIIEALTRN
jgi:CubicO group peptidase (beta-lactamase class C family)